MTVTAVAGTRVQFPRATFISLRQNPPNLTRDEFIEERLRRHYSLPPRYSDPNSVELAVDRVRFALAKDFKFFSFLLFIAGAIPRIVSRANVIVLLVHRFILTWTIQSRHARPRRQ